MASELSQREITGGLVMGVGGGGGVAAGVLFTVTGYVGFGLVLVLLGALICWGGWRYRSGGEVGGAGRRRR